MKVKYLHNEQWFIYTKFHSLISINKCCTYIELENIIKLKLIFTTIKTTN